MTKSEKRRRYCSSCTNNFYNGNNELGVKECWMLEESVVVRKKFVHIDQRPPWDQEAVRTLSCRHRSQYIAVSPGVIR